MGQRLNTVAVVLLVMPSFLGCVPKPSSAVRGGVQGVNITFEATLDDWYIALHGGMGRSNPIEVPELGTSAILLGSEAANRADIAASVAILDEPLGDDRSLLVFLSDSMGRPTGRRWRIPIEAGGVSCHGIAWSFDDSMLAFALSSQSHGEIAYIVRDPLSSSGASDPFRIDITGVYSSRNDSVAWAPGRNDAIVVTCDSRDIVEPLDRYRWDRVSTLKVISLEGRVIKEVEGWCNESRRASGIALDSYRERLAVLAGSQVYLFSGDLSLDRIIPIQSHHAIGPHRDNLCWVGGEMVVFPAVVRYWFPPESHQLIGVSVVTGEVMSMRVLHRVFWE